MTKIYLSRNVEDISLSGIQDNDYLQYDSASEEWNPDSGITVLNDLTDVSIIAPVSGEILKYNGSLWVNASP